MDCGPAGRDALGWGNGEATRSGGRLEPKVSQCRAQRPQRAEGRRAEAKRGFRTPEKQIRNAPASAGNTDEGCGDLLIVPTGPRGYYTRLRVK